MGDTDDDSESSKRYKVLIADDEALMHDLYEDMIDRDDCEFVSAYDGVQTVQVYLDEDPDLIILDYKMPGRNGIEAMYKIRTLHKYRRHYKQTTKPMPRMMMCSANRGIRYSAEQAGIDYFLDKPVKQKDLLDLVNMFLPTAVPPTPIPDSVGYSHCHGYDCV
jgi:CheY-like chemotaxis protein